MVGTFLYVKYTNAHFEKKYALNLAVSNYDGAINVAKKWKESREDYGPAVFALAKAYHMNFQLRKAKSVIVKFVKHSNPKDKNIAFGYAASAYYQCESGSYNQAQELYQNVVKLYPESYDKITPMRYLCKMNEFAADSHIDQKAYDDFKKEVSEYLIKTKDARDDVSFNKANLAYFLLGNKSLALKFAKDGLEEAELKAEKVFGAKSMIPANVKDRVAIFYVLNGDATGGFKNLGCGTNCNAEDLLRQGNDPFFLARFFSLVNDLNSADICMRALWKRMNTEEQKEQFFKYVMEESKRDNPWSALREIEWVKKEYVDFKKKKEAE
jgi:hypothetical protein